MTSAIDATKPVYGTPTTASVRANFQTAHDEITALQAGTVPEAPLDGALYGRASGAWVATATFVAGALVLGGGAGAAATGSAVWSETGGVLTANYGAAGGFLGTEGIYISGIAGGNQGLQIDGYTTVSLVGRRANGTPAAPSPLTSNQTLISLTGGGHDGTAWSNQGGAGVGITAGANWAPGDHSGEVTFSVTPIGSTTRTTVCKIAQDASLTWSGLTPQGVGSINLPKGYYIAGVNILTGKAAGQLAPTNPAGTASATAVMMGLAGSLHPNFNTAARLTICGTAANSVAGAGGIVQIRYGTGTAPANGTAASGVGTMIGSGQSFTSCLAAASVPFSLDVVITGLTAGTTYWYDVSLAAVGGGTATLIQVACARNEV